MSLKDNTHCGSSGGEGITVPTLPPLTFDAPYTRQPGWQRFVRRNCPVCSIDNSASLCIRPDGMLVSKCVRCGMIYLSDVPIQQELRNMYYNYSSFKGYRARGTKDDSGLVGRWRSSFRARRDFYMQVLIRSGGVKAMRLLEVGSSQGKFLRLAQSVGAVVSGVEPDAQAREAAMQRLGVKSYESIEDFPGTANIVCAFQVLEHVADPLSLLLAVRDRVHDDARLLIAVPNGGDAERVGPTWIGFRVDLEHLNYFTPSSLSRLLARSGFLVEQVWEHKQANTFRPRSVSNSSVESAGRRAVAPIQSMIGRLAKVQAPEDVWLQGSFNLTVLARASSVVEW